MPTLSNMQLPPPKNWQEFQDICCDLWREIWKDQSTQQNGREGQRQYGVDFFGRPNLGTKYAGVQCKVKDNSLEKHVTESELRAEVKKAKKFKPVLSEFILATTGPRDEKIQEVAREITYAHNKKKLFSVSVCSWDDIRNRLVEYDKLLKKHWPQIFPDTTDSNAVKIDSLKEATNRILLEQAEQHGDILSVFSEKIEELKSVRLPAQPHTDLNSEYHFELEYAKRLYSDLKPCQVIDYVTNLQDRIWHRADSKIKYRILTFKGAANLSLGKFEDAANLFIEAFQYSDQDENALYNLALGYLFTEQKVKAKDSAKGVLEKNPASEKAYALLLELSDIESKFEDILEQVPEKFQKKPIVSYAIAQIAKRKNLLVQAEEYFRLALSNDLENNPELKANFGSFLLELASEMRPIRFLSKEIKSKKAKLEEAISFFDQAWDAIKDTELRSYKCGWIFNRGIAKKLLGNNVGAVADIEKAVEFDPSNSIYIKSRALLHVEQSEFQKAIDLLKNVVSSEPKSDASLLLAETLRNIDDFKEAIGVLENFLKNDLLLNLKKDADRLLAILYIDLRNFEKAREIIIELRKQFPTDVKDLVLEAIFYKRQHQTDQAKALLREAKKYVTDETTAQALILLSGQLYALELYEDTIDVLEKITDNETDSVFTRQLANAYYHSGESQKALEICSTIRSVCGPEKFYSEMESAIYEAIGDLPKANEVCEIYISHFPNDFSMKLRKGVIDLRSNNLNKVDELLNSSIDVKSLNLKSGLLLSFLYLSRNKALDALKAMYELRRKYFNDAEAHLRYVGLFFESEEALKGLLETEKVVVDSAVLVEHGSGEKEWYIIELRDDVNFDRNELNINLPLSRKLLEKTINSEVVLRQDAISPDICKILEIKSKYVYALHESMKKFNKLFPENKGIELVRVDFKETDGQKSEGVNLVIKQVNEQHKVILEIERLYQNGVCTIGTISQVMKADPLQVWANFIHNDDIGLRCCNGSVAERQSALYLLNQNFKLIVDFISLMTIHGISAQDVIAKNFWKLGIAQSTLDLLEEIIASRKGMQAKGFMKIFKEGAQFFRQEISRDEVEKSREYLQQILNWTKDNCDVLPCNCALQLNRRYKDELDRLIGRSFVDTALIASEKDNLLFSDDERYRAFMKAEFNVEGVWTQALLLYGLNKGKIDKDAYNNLIIKLAGGNYKHTSIDSSTLIEAARQSNWEPKTPYTGVLKVLNGNNSELMPAVVVSSNFIFELWLNSVISEKRDYLLLKLLDQLTYARDRRVALYKLISHLKNKFTLLPFAERETIKLIEIWQKLHVS